MARAIWELRGALQSAQREVKAEEARANTRANAYDNYWTGGYAEEDSIRITEALARRDTAEREYLRAIREQGTDVE